MVGYLSPALTKTIPEPARATQIGRVLAAEREEFQDECYKGVEDRFRNLVTFPQLFASGIELFDR